MKSSEVGIGTAPPGWIVVTAADSRSPSLLPEQAKMCESSLFTRGFTHFGSFRGKRMALERKLRCLYIFLFHFAPLILWPPAYQFCVFSRKRGHRSPCDFTVEKCPRPPAGQKKSESTHYQIHQFARNNTYSDVFQSLLSIQTSPVYYTLSLYYSTKRATKCKNIFEASKFSSQIHPVHFFTYEISKYNKFLL